MRYLVPLFLALVVVASALLAASSVFYAVALAAQVLFYATAAASWMLESVGVHSRLLALPQYFVLTNLASVLAFYKFLRGERYARWEPIREGASAAETTLAGAATVVTLSPEGRARD
jgi:hypothetical protein